ncbi:bifunctional DNA primase/polymerase [Rhizobium sp. 11_C7_N12_5]|uniref:bifunctional DNA primase/polymerase n=1 Tax=Rhizobium sp. 11_C7_N12_5 TaxID=3240770 RepID=UPI003F27C954
MQNAAISLQPDTPIDVAREHLARGAYIFPCRSATEEFVDQATGEIETRAEKTPLLPTGFRGATINAPLIERTWARYQKALIGVATGSKSGFFVLDVDNKPGGANGFEWLAEMEAEHGQLPQTARVTSPNGGMHVYFKHAEGVRNRGALGAGVDIRGEGGYVIGPGSVMHDGRSYKWVDDTREIADAPPWLLDLLLPKSAPAHTGYTASVNTNSAYVDAAVDQELRDLSAVPMGNRNNALNDASFSLGRWVGGGHLPESEARALLQDVARGWGRDWARCCKTIENGLKAGIQNPRQPPEPDFYQDNTRPLDPAMIKRLVENSLRKQAAKGAAEAEPANDNKPVPAEPKPFSIFDWPASRFVGDPPPIEYLVDGVIPLGVPGMVSAMGDTGKSFAMLELHRRVAFGQGLLAPDVFGGRVNATGTSVMITSEDDAGEVHRRIAALDAKAERDGAAGRKMIVVPLPSAGGARAFWREDRKKGLIETDDYLRICDELSSITDLRLVTFDPLASFAHLPLNEDPAAGQFVCTSLSRLASETGATVLVAHHMRKTQKPIENLGDARDAIRGTSALVDGVRLAYAMWPADEARAKRVCKEIGQEYIANKIVLGGIVKTNGPAKRLVSTLVRNEFGLLVDRTSNIGAALPAQGDLLAALVIAVEGAATSGQPFTKTGATGLYAMRERLPEELRGVSRHRLEGLAATAIERGELVLCLASGTTAKWLDVPGGQFAIGLGNFRKGSVRS